MELKPDVLYDVAEPVPDQEDMYWLATGMLEAMQREKGIGLAAPQVAESVRLIVGGSERLGWSFVCINPVVVKTSDRVFPSFESCLSFPGKRVKMYRAKIVVVKGFNLEWEPIRIKARGLLSAVLQHEIDHLNGVCIA